MNILDQIVAHKRQETEERKSLYPPALLERSPYFSAPCVSLRRYLLRSDLSGIIAEFKRRSPSAGEINPFAPVEHVSVGYMKAGASALSILTDSRFFGGKNEDLIRARQLNYCPILRKDFILEEYQIIEARSIGADAILLIASILQPEEVSRLARFAHSLGMEVLLEVHDAEELDRSLCAEVDLVGVNNRNLKDFSVSLGSSLALAAQIPDSVIKVAESGLGDPAQVLRLREAGYRGFLMGQHFMQQARPEQACARFIARLRALSAPEPQDARA